MKISELLKPLSIFMLIGFMVFVVACSEDDALPSDDQEEEEQEEEEEEEEETETIDMAVFKDLFYSDDVSVVVNETTITITTKDLPDHKSMYYDQNSDLYEAYSEPNNPDFKQNPGSIGEQNVVMTIPRFPEVASNHESPGLGAMGVAINSVVFFNQQAAPGDDIFEEENTFDQYEGHPAGDQYHYHIEPIWITELKGSDAFLGFLLDGFPVYGPMEDGKEITNADLDDYHGHISATKEFPNGVYHYHITTEYPWINGNGYYGTPGTKTQ
ncbi:MAG: YHYH protein [Cyclobacteriaceae bacterium]